MSCSHILATCSIDSFCLNTFTSWLCLCCLHCKLALQEGQGLSATLPQGPMVAGVRTVNLKHVSSLPLAQKSALETEAGLFLYYEPTSYSYFYSTFSTFLYLLLSFLLLLHLLFLHLLYLFLLLASLIQDHLPTGRRPLVGPFAE